jgi:hypothetical protein
MARGLRHGTGQTEKPIRKRENCQPHQQGKLYVDHDRLLVSINWSRPMPVKGVHRKAGKVRHIALARLALVLASGVAVQALLPAAAMAQSHCSNKLRGAVVDDCSSTVVAAGNNTEKSSRTSAAVPFRISVDGETVSESDNAADAQRKTDLGLHQVDVQVKFDGLDATQILASKAVVGEGGQVRFDTSTNYANFISAAEVRVFEISGDEAKTVGHDPVKVIGISSSDPAIWDMPRDPLKKYGYVFRVYDDKGRFDETKLQEIGSKEINLDVTKSEQDLTGDQARVRNISVYGGAVTVFAKNIPVGYSLDVEGMTVTPDASNQVLFQQILPPGDHDIDVVVRGGKGSDLEFTRQISIPKNDWFYVALADLTIGRKLGDHVEATAPGEFDRTFTKGRLAFYLKGKIKGKYLLTASVDTGEDDIKNLFSNIDSKDPRRLLKRLDPDDYYPIYGDDSTIIEDAPTSGKAYIRLDRGQSHVMWGNFKTTVNGTEFARLERGLYGAHGLYKSEATTSFGEPKVTVEAFAAQPGTVPQRDNFLGTGGSAYFLKHQDVNSGSETVTIELRDALSGRVVSRRQLTEGTDYRIDYMQGVIMLSQPLSEQANGGGAVTGGGTDRAQQHLVVNYETTPTLMDENGLTAGGRAEAWLGDHVRFGGTATQETVNSNRNRKIEADVTLRHSDKTSVTFEVAQSEGKGLGQSFSSDGGLTFLQETPVGARGQRALAWRIKAQADLGEVSGGALDGNIGASYEHREAGFSALTTETSEPTTTYGGDLELNVTEDTLIRINAEATETSTDKRQYRVSGELESEISENWLLTAGVTWTRLDAPTKSYASGDRVDAGARLTYKVDEDTSVYAFAQGTLKRSGNRQRNDRAGFGGTAMLNDRFGVEGEVSYGTTGFGGEAKLSYKQDEDKKYYIGYRLDPDRSANTDASKPALGKDQGVIVAGVNTRLNDWTTAFTESKIDLFGKSRTIGQTYGLSFTPDEIWSASLGMSLGSVANPYGDDFKRQLYMARAAYTGERLKASLTGEVRIENSDDDTNDRTTYLLGSSVSWKSDDNWRVLASLDALLSKSNQDSILDGDYIEASVGAAYRPIDNDKLNVLFKYTYLYDLPGAQQVNTSDSILGPAQRSHVLSVDADYDVNEWLTVGGKYGFRSGEVSTSRDASDFTKSTAHLGIIRADLHVIKRWDLMAEARVLHGVEARQTDYGFLAAVYRHVGENMKMGVGYNFGRFSDDITDLTHDDEGAFLNVVGSF